jgi:hypothetical protein
VLVGDDLELLGHLGQERARVRDERRARRDLRPVPPGDGRADARGDAQREQVQPGLPTLAGGPDPGERRAHRDETVGETIVLGEGVRPLAHQGPARHQAALAVGDHGDESGGEALLEGREGPDQLAGALLQPIAVVVVEAGGLSAGTGEQVRQRAEARPRVVVPGDEQHQRTVAVEAEDPAGLRAAGDQAGDALARVAGPTEHEGGGQRGTPAGE